MKALDPELLASRSTALEGHLARIAGALPGEVDGFRPGTDTADVTALNLFLAIQIVLDLSVYACIHFGLQAPSSYDDAVARLEHAGVIADPLADHLEKAATLRDAFVHASDQLDSAALYRAARVLPDDLRAFVAELRYQTNA